MSMSVETLPNRPKAVAGSPAAITGTLRTRGFFVMVGAVLGATLAATLSSTASGQCPPTWEASPADQRLADRGFVNAIVSLGDGTAVVAGDFLRAGQASLRRIGRLNLGTGTWTPLGDGLGVAVASSDAVTGLVVLPDGDIIAAGRFEALNGTPASHIARFSLATGEWTPLPPGFTGQSQNTEKISMVVLPDGDLLVGGMIGGGLLRHDFSTEQWRQVVDPQGAITFWNATCMTSTVNGNVLVGTYSHGLLMYNPQSDVLIGAPGPMQFTGAVTAVLEARNGDLVFAGDIASVPRVARLQLGTGQFSTLGEPVLGGTQGSVSTLWEAGDGMLYAAGFFNQIGGIPARNIARYDSLTGSWSSLGGVDWAVRSLAQVSPDTFLVGGSFQFAHVEPPNATNALTPGLATLHLRSPGPVVVAQPIGTAVCRALPASFTVATSPALPVTFQWRRNGVPISVAANATANTGTLQIVRVRAADAGSYDCIVTNACGMVTTDPVLLIARDCACLQADVAGGGDSGLEPDGTVDGTDFVAFINSFAIGDATVDPIADVAGGGVTGDDADGTIDGSDFIAFINAFAIGC